MLLRDLEQNCEFEADDAVLRSGADRCGYQMELVGRASDGRSLPLASMFRHSGLFRRIWMIQKEMPASRVYLRLMYVLPMAAAAVPGTWRGAGDGTSGRNREGAAVSVYGAGCHEPFRAVVYGQHRVFGQRTGRVGSQSEMYVPDGSGRTGEECHDHAERCGE